MTEYHKTVLLQETVDFLDVSQGKQYIDGTLGAGGHTEEITKRGGIVLGIDVDQDALAYVRKKIPETDKLTLARGNFRDIDKIALAHGFSAVFGIVLDLGVSSYQIDTSARGFSFMREGPLDMRMDQDLGIKAADLVNALSTKELTELFKRYGEETQSGKIARTLVEVRKKTPFQTTDDLVRGIAKAFTMREQDIQMHRASISARVFQALRIAVNDELHALTEALPKAFELLQPKGRLAIITFHSLEDREVKHAFVEYAKRGVGLVLTKKPVEASMKEKEENPRSRSAKLRVIEKI